MSKNKAKGVVYSTNPDFELDFGDQETPETLPNGEQNLKVLLDKKARAGKQVTIVVGFVGSPEDLEQLAKKIKNTCGSGGSVKDCEILIQGDHRPKVLAYLLKEGYKAKQSGG
jgi:translation initiation factor 1